ncbi:hypothetical protein JJB11_23300 [Ramlibacter ginsenosidimutans]|uniref:Lipoprotein n=1 Tax=Ramlibacter ginsenosidimutans TaxID=502333 RepID=A0A934WPW0_9BURK|nr:hypothetical protein [Ramlibacter ginsenosidimutans]MBK6009036.1 hypothetical protein [Ramlibacter ginsenosidimutans]
MKKLIPILAALAMAATLTACGGGGGGGGGSTAQVAASNTTIAMDASNGQTVTSSVTGKSFNFASGVADFGTSGATALTLGASNSFQVASGSNTASGTMSFGSCHFKVTSSTFTSGPLVNGNTVTVTNCQLLVLTKGQPADSSQQSQQAELVLDGAASATVTVTVAVTADGRILVNNVSVGTAALTPVTGA